MKKSLFFIVTLIFNLNSNLILEFEDTQLELSGKQLESLKKNSKVIRDLLSSSASNQRFKIAAKAKDLKDLQNIDLINLNEKKFLELIKLLNLANFFNMEYALNTISPVFLKTLDRLKEGRSEKEQRALDKICDKILDINLEDLKIYQGWGGPLYEREFEIDNLVDNVNYSPDKNIPVLKNEENKKIGIGQDSNEIFGIIDLETAEVVKELDSLEGVDDIQEGNFIAIQNDSQDIDQNFIFVNAKTGQIWELSPNIAFSSVSSDGKYLVVLESRKDGDRLLIFNLEQKIPKPVFERKIDRFFSVFVPNTHVLIFYNSKGAYIYDIDLKKYIYKAIGNFALISDDIVSSNGKSVGFVKLNNDGETEEIIVVEVESDKRIASMKVPKVESYDGFLTENEFSLKFSPDGNYLAYIANTSYNKLLKVFDISLGKYIYQTDLISDQYAEVNAFLGNNYLAVTSGSNFNIIDLINKKIVHTLQISSKVNIINNRFIQGSKYSFNKMRVVTFLDNIPGFTKIDTIE